MGKIQELERQVTELSPEELTQFREWFADFDTGVWDRQFEADVDAGKLDAPAKKALDAHTTGRTTKL